MVRVGLLLSLLFWMWEQLLEYRAQPVSTSFSRQLAPFPRLTLCPGSKLYAPELEMDRMRKLGARQHLHQ